MVLNQTPASPLELEQAELAGGDLPPSYEEAVASGSRPVPAPPRPAPNTFASSASGTGTPITAKQSRQPPQQQSSSLPLRPNATTSSSSSPSSSAVARQFPPMFNLYGDGVSRTLILGEHQQQPLYAVRLRFPSRWSSEPPIVLHNGPDADRAPPLAAVDFEPWTGSMVVTLPPPLSADPRRPASRAPGSSEVRLEFAGDFGFPRVYRFAMEVGATAQQLRGERFEWRHSMGEAVASLGGARDGWKLVRIAMDPPRGAAPGRWAPTGPMTSDGREVVAIWSDAVMSVTKRAKFAFVGTGNSGVLGERWAVMVVASALAIWGKETWGNNRRRRF